MNKDVIYIEPDYDITDVVEKIKSAKNKIIALVPPKKAGVLSTVVNFRILQKAAGAHDKTLVLITGDANMTKLAYAVKMPVAKTLNSKPQLPSSEATEFGDSDDEDDLIEEAEPEQSAIKSVATSNSSSAKHKNSSSNSQKTSKKHRDDEDVDMELSEDENADEADDAKKNKNVPNFEKYRVPIIVGVVAVLLLIAFIVWATVFAPAMKINVSVRTSDKNFAKTVSLVSEKSAADPEAGILYAETKTLDKTASSDFEATGKRDEGEKASGSLTVSLAGKVTISCKPVAGTAFDIECVGSQTRIPKGTTFTHDNMKYVSSADVTLAAPKIEDVDTKQCSKDGFSSTCPLKNNISATVAVVASESGDKYNTDGSGSWSASMGGISVKGGAISGGTSKEVTFVSQDDILAAEEKLSVSSQGDARKELEDELKDEYIIISDSFEAKEDPVQTSPALNGAITDGANPKIIKKSVYSVLAVKREDVDQYIRAELEKNIGDDTQDIYITGALDVEGDESKHKKAYPARAFFEAYRTSGNDRTAKLKSVAKTGPRITNDMIAEKALGKKSGEVRNMLSSINGVSDVQIERSYPWVTSVPKDVNKVEINISVE